ncbi:MAG: MazG nucleotide pyrophosphohydrolase domain-containing protein [Candidatus Gracilibacteria bacterium]
MPKNDFKKLLKLAEKLRSPTGCPWDRKQTILSMLEHLEEECQEVVDAAKKGDNHNLKEELGDLMFQIIMITQIAKEQKLFNMDGVTDGIAKKIISRHTWVFGKDKAKTPEDAIRMWLKNKEKEKKRG